MTLPIFKKPEIKTSKKFKYILIDGNNLFYRAFISQNDINNLVLNYNTMVQFPIEDFFKRIDSIMEEYGYSDSQLYVLFDNPSSLYRKRREIDTGYKHKREKNALNTFINKMINNCFNILKYYRNNTFIVKSNGFEADDLVKPIIDNLNVSHYNQCLVISNDMDWARILNDNVFWFNYKTFFDRDVFETKYKFYPSQGSIITYKALHGDASDCIDNAVPNLPEQYLLNIVKSVNTFDELKKYIIYNKELPKHWKEKIHNNLEKIRINYQLVDFAELDFNVMEEIRECKRHESSLKVLTESIDLKNLSNKFSFKKENNFFKKKVRL